MKLLLVLSSITLCSSKDVAKRDFFGIPIEAERQVPIGEKYWNCGGEAKSTELSFRAVGNMCPDRMPELNTCCAVHDDCYGLALGRDKCDVTFCKCIMNTALHISNRHQNKCKEKAMEIACGLVTTAGFLFYNTPSGGIAKKHYPILNSTAVYFYQKLYEDCDRVDKTLLSCAYNHIICHLGLLPKEAYNLTPFECRKQLVECLGTNVVPLQLAIKNEKCLNTYRNAVKAIYEVDKDTEFYKDVILSSSRFNTSVFSPDVGEEIVIDSNADENDDSSPNLDDEVFIGFFR